MNLFSLQRENKIKTLDDQIAELEAKISATEKSIEDALVGKEETVQYYFVHIDYILCNETLFFKFLQPEREEALKAQAEVQEQNLKLKSTCRGLAALDPEYIEEQRKNIKIAFESANRWTDNIFAAQSYCVKQMGLDKSTFNQYFDLSEDFDYVELK